MVTAHEVKKVKACRVCGFASLQEILSLGDLHVSNFIDEAEQKEFSKYPLTLVLCNKDIGGCGLLQLQHTVPNEVLYRNYWYRSGINATMTRELEAIARTAEEMAGLKEGDSVIDIGANDGTLLRGYGAKEIHRIGFEPADNLERYNSVGTTKVFKDFFDHRLLDAAYPGLKAKVITAIAMFYDLEHPNDFVANVARALDQNGVFVVQQSYLPLMLETNEIGNICHEHLEYYSLLSLENLLARHGLEVFDVIINDINGGSFRTYIRHKGKGTALRIEPGAAERVAEMRESEKKLGLHTKEIHDAFVARVRGIKDQLIAFLREEKEKGKTIYGYGASTKGNTLLQFFGLGPDLITAIAERNPDKWGKKTIGTLIPIVSEEDARAAQPDYFLVLPWHFIKEFREREAAFLARGGKFIVPMPQFSLIEKDSARDSADR